MMDKVNSWLRQPSTIAGLMCLSAALTAIINGATLQQALLGIVPGVLGVVVKDHTVAAAQAAQK